MDADGDGKDSKTEHWKEHSEWEGPRGHSGLDGGFLLGAGDWVRLCMAS